MIARYPNGRRVCELHDDPHDCVYFASMCRNRPASRPTLRRRVADAMRRFFSAMWAGLERLP